ncbi:MAG: FAD-dependent oxidoreductase [Bacillota bacterium]
MSDSRQQLVKELVDGLGSWFKDEKRLQEGRMTSSLYPYIKLFEPIHINRLKIKNRIIMGPMGNASMADETGKPSAKMIEYFRERAAGGAGLITCGMTPVSWDLDPSYGDLHNTGIFPRLDSNRTAMSGWKTIAEACHAYGARFFVQLAPGVGRVGNPECLTKKYRLPVSSSWNPNWYIPQIPCRPLTDRECRHIIKKTGQIALDLKELGIDGVYLHGHSGYLIEQMTDTAFNRRKLGRYSDWQRFGLDMVEEIRKRCGNAYPIHYRIDLSLALNETYGEKMHTGILKKFRNGRTAAMTLEYMEKLVKSGVDAFDVDLGGYDNWWLPHPPNGMPPGVYLAVSEAVKAYFKERNIKSNVGFQVPIIAVGKLGYPDLAEQALREERCDMIMLSRPLLADPEWPKKVYAGKVDEIAPCIGDHEGCLGQYAAGGHIHCAVNPRAAFEDKLQILIPAQKPKKIAVVGAGPAGVTAACTAAKRGHKIWLYDRNDKAGGMLIPGSVPKIKYDMQNYVDYLNKQIEKAAVENSLNVCFNTAIDEKTLKNEQYDSIIICSGTKPVIPKVEGIELPHVVTGIDLLKNPTAAADSKNIAVIGGSDVGCEIAYMLSCEYDKKVTVIEMLPYFMKKTCTSNRYYLIHHLEKKGVRLLNCTILKKILPGSVQLMRNAAKNVPNPYETWTPVLPDNIVNPFAPKLMEAMQAIELEADLVVLCTGARPDDSLYDSCVRNHAAPEINNIGDSFSMGRVLEAVKAGYAIGTSI